MRAFHTSHTHTRPQHPARHVPPKNGMEPYALRPGPTIRKTSCVSHGLETEHWTGPRFLRSPVYVTMAWHGTVRAVAGPGHTDILSSPPPSLSELPATGHRPQGSAVAPAWKPQGRELLGNRDPSLVGLHKR